MVVLFRSRPLAHIVGRFFGGRRLQFSLRMFLVAMASVCIAMGWCVVPMLRQRELVAHILQAGGAVSYPGRRDPMIGPTSTEFELGQGRRNSPPIYLDLISSPIYVQFHRGGATDDLCGRLANLSGLQYVSLDGSPITDFGLDRLLRLKKLDGLSLARTEISDDGLRKLSSISRIKSLDLEGTNVSDDSIACIAGLIGLDFLNLKQTQITDRGLNHLTGLRQLGILLLRGSKTTDDGVRRFKQAVPGCHVFLTKAEWTPTDE